MLACENGDFWWVQPMTHLSSHLHAVQLVAMTLLWQKEGIWPFTATGHELQTGNLSFVTPQFVRLCLFCETYFPFYSSFSPVFFLLMSLWMWCEYTVELSIACTCILVDSQLSDMRCCVHLLLWKTQTRGDSEIKQIGKGYLIFSLFLHFYFFFFHFHIIWADKYEDIFICLIIRAEVCSMC